MGKPGADPFPEAHAVEEPGEDAAQAAADEGIDQDGPHAARRLAEPAPLGHDDGDHRDHDAQHAVVGGGPVADAVDEIDDIADHDAGDISPQGGHQHRAQPIQIQGQRQDSGQKAAQAVDQDAYRAEKKQLQQPGPAARSIFEFALIHILTSGEASDTAAAKPLFGGSFPFMFIIQRQLSLCKPFFPPTAVQKGAPPQQRQDSFFQ